MKSKIAIPVISFLLVVIAVVSAFAAVYYEKNKKIRLALKDVIFSEITVEGNKMTVTITASNSLGMKITDNTYTYENGALKFKLYGSKNLEIGKPLTENQVVTLVIETEGAIEKIYFLALNDKGEEVEYEKSFAKG